MPSKPRFLPSYLIALTLGLTSYGCSTMPSPAPQVLPSNLTAYCESYETATDSSLEAILRAHVRNMERARVCADRHNNLVDLLGAPSE